MFTVFQYVETLLPYAAMRLMKNSESSRYFPPFSIEQLETAYNNARNYADLLAADSAALTAFCIAFPSDAGNYADLSAADDVVLAASRIASQARARLESFISDLKSPSGFLMDQEELTGGFNLTSEWLDMATRRRDFGELQGIIQVAIDNTVKQL